MKMYVVMIAFTAIGAGISYAENQEITEEVYNGLTTDEQANCEEKIEDNENDAVEVAAPETAEAATV